MVAGVLDPSQEVGGLWDPSLEEGGLWDPSLEEGVPVYPSRDGEPPYEPSVEVLLDPILHGEGGPTPQAEGPIPREAGVPNLRGVEVPSPEGLYKEARPLLKAFPGQVHLPGSFLSQ